MEDEGDDDLNPDAPAPRTGASAEAWTAHKPLPEASAPPRRRPDTLVRPALASQSSRIPETGGVESGSVAKLKVSRSPKGLADDQHLADQVLRRCFGMVLIPILVLPPS